jgi:V/A-type H+/Na+-transporting ATPase subunit I
MAIARLSSVVLVCSRREVGVFLSELCRTGQFHPSDRGGLVQDTELVILASKAHAIYSDANGLLGGRKGEVRLPHTFRSSSMVDLVRVLSEQEAEASRALTRPDLDPAGRESAQAELEAVREGALTVFRDVSRLRVRPGTRRLLVFEGFVPTEEVAAFSSSLSPFFLHAEPIPRRQAGVPYVPSLLVNPRVVNLFEGITLSLGVPKYNEVDPTPLVAFVFPLFFGIMFSDLGRGLVLFAAGFYLRDDRKEAYRYLGRLLLVLGSSAMLVGALRGLFFGLRLPYAPLLPSPSFLVQGPNLQTVTFWLEVGLVIGTFHLAAGYALAITNRILSKDYGEAFLGYAPTLALYASTIPFVLAVVGAGVSPTGVFTSTQPTPFFTTLLGLQVPVWVVADITFPVMLASLLLLLFGRALFSLATIRLARPALRALGQGVADALVRPAELFVHTISYVRLGVLLVVESVFGELLAGIASTGPVGVAIAIPGNLVVIAIMAFIVYLQDLRLNVYEWFSKFYSGVGTPFSPLVSGGSSFSVVWEP